MGIDISHVLLEVKNSLIHVNLTFALVNLLSKIAGLCTRNLSFKNCEKSKTTRVKYQKSRKLAISYDCHFLLLFSDET